MSLLMGVLLGGCSNGPCTGYTLLRCKTNENEPGTMAVFDKPWPCTSRKTTCVPDRGQPEQVATIDGL
jgi:hypothetical protein